MVLDSGEIDVRRVEVLRREDDRILIASGLATGDRVVAGPLAVAVDGMAVRVFEDPNEERDAVFASESGDSGADTFARADQRPGEDLDARRRMLKAGTYMVTHMHEAPAIVFVGVKQDQAVANVLRSPSTLAAFLTHFGPLSMARVLASTPRITALADGSTAYPAVQNLLLAARALGLGAVLTTPQFFVPGQFEALLDLPSDFTLAAVIPVGYPMGKFGKVKRPGAEEVVSWERYEG